MVDLKSATQPGHRIHKMGRMRMRNVPLMIYAIVLIGC